MARNFLALFKEAANSDIGDALRITETETGIHMELDAIEKDANGNAYTEKTDIPFTKIEEELARTGLPAWCICTGLYETAFEVLSTRCMYWDEASLHGGHIIG